MKISVILPVYNESKSLKTLFKEIEESLLPLKVEYEIVAVNDGSKDDSLSVLKEIAQKDARVKVVSFVANAGKTAAMSAAFSHATGDIWVTLDSDLQNDPKDIPMLLKKLDEGYDVVSGWRQNRWPGSFFSRKLPSMTANWLISKVAQCNLHDYGCMLKVYRAKVLQDVALYGEMQRFLPAFASWRGARIAEMPVNYRDRKFGKSNFGFSRTFQVMLDLILVRFLRGYMTRPMHFFGIAGFVSLLLGFLAGAGSIVLKILEIKNFVQTPLPIFSALLIIVGIQFFATGVVAEILMRVYFEAQRKTTYIIDETINISSR